MKCCISNSRCLINVILMTMVIAFSGSVFAQSVDQVLEADKRRLNLAQESQERINNINSAISSYTPGGYNSLLIGEGTRNTQPADGLTQQFEDILTEIGNLSTTLETGSQYYMLIHYNNHFLLPLPDP